MTLKSYLEEYFEAGRDENRVKSMPSVHGQDQLKNTGVENKPVIKQSLCVGKSLRKLASKLFPCFLCSTAESQKLSTYHPRTIEHHK